MSIENNIKYSSESPAHLTERETDLLVSYLSDHWPDAFEAPLYVDEGYGLHQTLRGDAGLVLFVGRAGIYERMAKERLRKINPQDRVLRGLYYPTATPSRSLLYQAALYFDELFITHPGSAVFENRRNPYYEPDPGAAAKYEESHLQFKERLSKFDEEVLILKEEGILHSLPPQMQDHPQFIELITADLGDPQFASIVRQSESDPVFIAAKKMEPLLPLVGDGMSLDEIREELHYRSKYAQRIAASKGCLFEPDIFGVKEVQPVLGSSILLNHAFLLSQRYNLIPFTDNSNSIGLLQCKLRRIASLPGFPDYRRELDLTAGSLAVRVLEEYLPRFEFEEYEQVIEARRSLAHPLIQFRESMRSFAAEIDESPYSPTFMRKIEQTMAIKIRPAVQAIESEIQKSRDSFIVKCLRNARAGSIPVIASIFAGLPAEAVLALSAGVLTFEAAIETYKEVKRTRHNGLNLLLG